MNNKMDRTISRREFAQRAAVLSATASLVPSGVLGAHPVVPQAAQNTPRLSSASQAEADSRYQQILSLYSDRLDDAQKANIKRMCVELQPSLERVRNFKLDNGDGPSLYLKPLVERQKKPAASSTSKPSASPAKP